MAKKPRTPTKPEPEQVKAETNWQDTVKTALQKKKPAGGFPKPPDTRHK
jgi:hypothetical protein